MKNLILITWLIFFSCKNTSDNKSLSITEFPTEFINIKTNIQSDITPEVDGILEAITNYDISYTLNNCNENIDGQICKGGNTEVKTDIFFHFDNNEKRLIVVDDRDDNCNCKSSGYLKKSMESIPLNKIGTIDTITTYTDMQGRKLLSLIINPKYKGEVIEYKAIRKYYDKDFIYHSYTKDSAIVNNPIFITTEKPLALHLKNLIEDLKEKLD